MHPSEEMVLRTAKVLFGISSFRPKQKDIILSLLEGRNTLAVLPTGAGKSVTFQVPAMILEGLTLVVTPLISLMKDQVQGLFDRGIGECDYLSSGRTAAEITGIFQKLKGTKILYVTPERLESRSFRERLGNSGVRLSLVVIDEAHCVSLWGNTFRPSYRRIGDFLSAFPGATIAAFTGTASQELRRDIVGNLGGKNWNVIASTMERKNLSVSVRFVEDKISHLVERLDGKRNAVVYTGSKIVCEKLNHIFAGRGLPSAVYHAGLPPEIRDKNQKLFMDGEKKIMIATSAFGMGVDKKDIRAVYHYHIPFEAAEYYQEIGRAGRDGEEAVAELLVEPDDAKEMEVRLERRYPAWRTVRRILNERDILASDEQTKKEIAGMFSLDDFYAIREWKREYLLKRKNILGQALFMRSYVASSRCRSVMLMGYFGEAAGPCGKCDHCRAAASNYHSDEWTDGEIRTISALGGSRGKVRLEDLRLLLAGMRNKERLKSGFGSLRGTDRKVFGGIVSRLKNFHVLEFDPGNSSAGLNPLFNDWLRSR